MHAPKTSQHIALGPHFVGEKIRKSGHACSVPRLINTHFFLFQEYDKLNAIKMHYYFILKIRDYLDFLLLINAFKIHLYLILLKIRSCLNTLLIVNTFKINLTFILLKIKSL